MHVRIGYLRPSTIDPEFLVEKTPISAGKSVERGQGVELGLEKFIAE